MTEVAHIHEYRVRDAAGLRRLVSDLAETHDPPYAVTVHPLQAGCAEGQRALWKIWMKELCAETGEHPRRLENILLQYFGPWREFINEHGEFERRPARFSAREMSYQEARDLMTTVQAFMAEFGFTLQSKRSPSDPPPVVFTAETA